MTSSVARADAGSLLTTREVARRLRLSREAVNLAVREGRLQCEAQLPGVNGARLFTEQAVIEWRCPGDRLAGL